MRLESVFLEDTESELESAADRLRSSNIKRLIDFTGAAIGLLFLLPFLLLIAAVIFIDSPGPIFFVQRRTGYGGTPFCIYKFRTMTVLEDGPVVLPAVRHDERST